METWHVRQAARRIARGGIVAYPTEGVWGLGCDPGNPAAVTRLLGIKRRPAGKGLILIAHDFNALAPYLARIEPRRYKAALGSWPGPVTWLWPAAPGVDRLLRGRHETLAVRVTAHRRAAALCARFGAPVISTSANLAGHPPARTALHVRLRLGKRIDALLPGDTGGLASATEIRDVRTGRIRRPARY